MYVCVCACMYVCVCVFMCLCVCVCGELETIAAHERTFNVQAGIIAPPHT